MDHISVMKDAFDLLKKLGQDELLEQIDKFPL